MRIMMIPLAGLLLMSAMGCHCVMGKCDCDNAPTLGCHVYPVQASCAAPPIVMPVTATTPAKPTLLPVPPKTEVIDEMPRVTPDKE
jgi:hypothetical protein